MSSKKKRDDLCVMCLVGPTASGKSALAGRWLQKVAGGVINGDSQQLYQGLPILTAQPGPESLALGPHYLYGQVPLQTRVSVTDWCSWAREAIEELFSQGLQPILVGGTGFYLKALLEGVSPIPDLLPEIEGEIQHRLSQESGLEGLYEELCEVDLATCASLKKGDRYRISRAWGLWKQTGKSLAFFQSLPKTPWLNPGWNAKIFCLLPERQALYERINRRFQAMWEGGGLEEVAFVMKESGYESFPGFRALGAMQMACFLKGELSELEAIEKSCQLSRHYAKRQITWFRHQLPLGAQFIETFGEDADEEDFLNFIKSL